ncbi:DUF952 domain-containing protein [Hymenobacter psychrotolerans]|uniref:Uncharacterized conserved protein, DUF952 family n=1 Tax=Hymenobacter psychrotolerans DSM 18569 TaxID=1121959 RepID=A0A1M6XIL5_9BACT|nr:DUF952 domain-containing protein [Hymenobacter psychrotolerans]SHL05781.1 Uncharacterized conserved protein, DUF952 family [Hymenobacter psychrotolerans DSM 18569]
MLYRITNSADWQQAQQNGFFASPDLAAEGFIHCSEKSRILETARLYYAGCAGLYLLEVDEPALAAAGVQVEREWVERRQQHFAHVFGALPLAAVRRVWAFGTKAVEAEFTLPDEL